MESSPESSFAQTTADHKVLPWSKINLARGGSSDSHLAWKDGYIFRTHLDVLFTISQVKKYLTFQKQISEMCFKLNVQHCLW